MKKFRVTFFVLFAVALFPMQATHAEREASKSAPGTTSALSDPVTVGYDLQGFPPNFVSQEQYNFGKALLEGRMQPGVRDTAQVASQTQALNDIKNILPADVKKTVNVEALAGRLSAKHLFAIRYYVQKEFVEKNAVPPVRK